MTNVPSARWPRYRLPVRTRNSAHVCHGCQVMLWSAPSDAPAAIDRANKRKARRFIVSGHPPRSLPPVGKFGIFVVLRPHLVLPRNVPVDPEVLEILRSSDSPERGCRTALGSRSTTAPINPSVTSECDDAAAIDALSRFAGDQLIKDRAGDRAQ